MTVFTADSLTRARSGPCWADIVTSKLGTTRVEAVEGEDGFHGSLAMWSLGCLELAHVKLRGVPVRGVRQSRLTAGAVRSHIWVAVALSGTFELDYGSRTTLVTPGNMAVLDIGRTYVTTFAPDNDVVWMRVPRIYLEPCLSGGGQLFINGTHGAGRIALQSLEAVLGQAGRLRKCDGRLIANGLLSLLSAAADSDAGCNHGITSERRAVTLRQIKKYIIDNLSDESLSSRSIAEAFGLSPRYINKLFEDEGMSLMRWTWKQRLERARDALESPSGHLRSISDVAYAFGFKSLSHFSHAFHNQFGYTPRDARRQAICLAADRDRPD